MDAASEGEPSAGFREKREREKSRPLSLLCATAGFLRKEARARSPSGLSFILLYSYSRAREALSVYISCLTFSPLLSLLSVLQNVYAESFASSPRLAPLRAALFFPPQRKPHRAALFFISGVPYEAPRARSDLRAIFNAPSLFVLLSRARLSSLSRFIIRADFLSEWKFSAYLILTRTAVSYREFIDFSIWGQEILIGNEIGKFTLRPARQCNWLIQ